jgi:hypothetical protein
VANGIVAVRTDSSLLWPIHARLAHPQKIVSKLEVNTHPPPTSILQQAVAKLASPTKEHLAATKLINGDSALGPPPPEDFSPQLVAKFRCGPPAFAEAPLFAVILQQPVAELPAFDRWPSRVRALTFQKRHFRNTELGRRHSTPHFVGTYTPKNPRACIGFDRPPSRRDHAQDKPLDNDPPPPNTGSKTSPPSPYTPHCIFFVFPVHTRLRCWHRKQEYARIRTGTRLPLT